METKPIPVCEECKKNPVKIHSYAILHKHLCPDCYEKLLNELNKLDEMTDEKNKPQPNL